MKSAQFKLLLILQIVTLFLVAMLFFKQEGKLKSPLPLKDAGAKALSKKNIKVEYGDNFVYGKKDAPNELIVFTRYNCDYCRDFYNQVFDSLHTNYIDQGKLKVVFIDNVNPQDETGMLMAKVAEIAKKEGAYEKIQEAFYQNTVPEDSLEIIQIAIEEVGLDREMLMRKIESPEIRKQILADNKVGDQLRLKGTPTFVINGKMITGYMSYENLVKELK